MSERKWEPYLCEYHLDGRTWSVKVIACEFEDASRRLRAIGTTGRVLGHSVQEVPAVPGVGLLVRLWCFIANLFGAR